MKDDDKDPIAKWDREAGDDGELVEYVALLAVKVLREQVWDARRVARDALAALEDARNRLAAFRAQGSDKEELLRERLRVAQQEIQRLQGGEVVKGGETIPPLAGAESEEEDIPGNLPPDPPPSADAALAGQGV